MDRNYRIWSCAVSGGRLGDKLPPYAYHTICYEGQHPSEWDESSSGQYTLSYDLSHATAQTLRSHAVPVPAYPTTSRLSEMILVPSSQRALLR